MKLNCRVDVSPSSKNSDYSIIIGKNILTELGKFVSDKYNDHDFVIITDENVKKYQYENFIKYINSNKIYIIINKPGEESKSREVKNRIDDDLLSRHYPRKTLIFGFGGGVVGDLSGYIASTYKRGIPIIQIPTSLLSMVDSSVGGKTGINTKFGKNLIGSFWQPVGVFADIEMLKTLPQIEFMNGFAECLKTALILDKNLFEFMEVNIENIINRNADTVFHIIKRCVELKKEVVNLDTREKGIRQILNFGHTIGHAMETLSHYKIKHGFGVSIGMTVELKMSQLAGFITENDFNRIIDLFKKSDMPYKVPKEFSVEEISEIMVSDKKAEQGIPMFVLLDKIGKYRNFDNKFSFPVNDEIVEKSINFCKEVEWK